MAKSETEIRDWCLAYLARMLERSEIDPDDSFSRIGLDSAMALYFVTDLESWIGVELWPEVTAEHPSVTALSRHLAQAV